MRPALAQVDAHALAGGYAVGYVSYEAAPGLDPALTARRDPALPLVWFGLHEAALPLASTDVPASDTTPDRWACSTWQSDTDQAAYEAAVDEVRQAIARGDTYQVNYTMELRARFAGDPLALWHRLREQAGTAYAAYLDLGSHVVASLSPELLCDWDRRTVTARPMKGTRPRDVDHDHDQQLAAELAGSAKDRAENLMIVDLMRNDLARVCRPGTVTVSELFRVNAYPTVWQLTSTVSGQTSPEVGLVDLLAATFPCGSVTGAPKARTTKIISELEQRARGVYCGAVGLVRPGGSTTFNVAIRTLVLDRDRGTLGYGAGGGVVWDSTPTAEYHEAISKARLLDLTRSREVLVETMAFADARVPLLPRHLDRLAASAQWLGRPFDRSAADRLIGAVHGGPQRLRLLLDPGGGLELETAPLVREPPTPWPVALAVTPVDAYDPWLRHKITDRSRYDAHRRDLPDVRDVLLWNRFGEVTEFTIGNLVVELDGKRSTPPVTCGLLPGVFRAELLATGQVAERVLRAADLQRAERVWLINAVRGWVPVELRSD